MGGLAKRKIEIYPNADCRMSHGFGQCVWRRLLRESKYRSTSARRDLEQVRCEEGGQEDVNQEVKYSA